MNDHMIKTSQQWKSTSMIAYIPKLGTLCVELGENDNVGIKIGDGRRSYKNLPYVFEKSFNLIVEMQTNFAQKTLPTILSEYYRKEEIDQLLLEIHNEITNLNISEYVKTEDMKEYVKTTIEETTVPVSEEDLQRITDLEEKVDALPEPNVVNTGWVSASINNGNISSSNIEYRKMATELVEICGTFTPAISTSFNAFTLFTLPEEYRPHKKRKFAQLQSNALTPFLLTINTDGSVLIDSSSSITFDENQEYFIEAMYLAGSVTM